MYQLMENPITHTIEYVQRLSDMAIIPYDFANVDYQQYLEWLAEGNTPLPPKNVT